MFHVISSIVNPGLVEADLNLLTERSNHYKVSQGIKWTQAIAPVDVIVHSGDRSLSPAEMYTTQKST